MITKDVKLPTYEELTVPQEITLSTPWLKAVAPYMHRNCETEIKDFMLRRAESGDPRAALKEGAVVTACGVKFLQQLKKTCANETKVLAECIDRKNSRLYMSKCYPEQSVLDECIEEKLHIERPKRGYFSKLHVHDSPDPKPVRPMRDYKAEAAKVLQELPEDYHIRKDYKTFKSWMHVWDS